MSEGIELHDSELSAVSFNGDSAVITFAPAYLHHAGSGWSQSARLDFSGASPPTILPIGLPVWVSDGFLRIGDTTHNNLIPAEGSFDGAVEFSITLVTAETLHFRAEHVRIQLVGDPSYVEDLPDFKNA